MLHKWIDRATGLSSFIMLLMFIQLMFNPPLMLWTNRERFDFRYRKPVAVTAVSTVLNLFVTVVAVISTSYKAEARIIGTVSVQTLFGVIFAVLLFVRGKPFQKGILEFALRFNLPLIFYYVSQIILNQSDRIMINYYQGSGKAAVYSVAYSAATLMLLVLSSINGSFNPWMYKKLKAGKYRDVGQTASIVCLLVGGATFAVSALAPDLIRILATEEYMEAIWIIAPVSASVYFIFLYMVFANVEMYYGENNGISVISIICSVMNIVLNMIFIPMFGYFAAGWTTLVSYMVLTLLHFVLMKRACRRKDLPEKVFREKNLLAISSGVILLSFAAMGLYRLQYFRYAALAATLILAFAFRKRLIAVFHQIGKGGAEDEE